MSTKPYHILFSGHMIDKRDRKHPRFPADKEQAARAAIRSALLNIKVKILNQPGFFLEGIAGGACGGDILFHELCEELQIPSVVYLTLPAEAFKNVSVRFAGADWESRFDRLTKNLPTFVLDGGARSPDDEAIWEDTNSWMLTKALEAGGQQAHLITLWDEKAGDGRGGTEHMVQIVRQYHGAVDILNILKL